jgi:hypothetical protein
MFPGISEVTLHAVSFCTLSEDNNACFFLVENFAEFPFCSRVEAAYGLEIVSNMITVIDSPPTWI